MPAINLITFTGSLLRVQRPAIHEKNPLSFFVQEEIKNKINSCKYIGNMVSRPKSILVKFSMYACAFRVEFHARCVAWRVLRGAWTRVVWCVLRGVVVWRSVVVWFGVVS